MAPYFERTSRHVALTRWRERMHAEVGPAYGRLREAFEDHPRAGRRGITGRQRIGLYTPLSAGCHMVEIVRAFTVRYPACEVVFVNTGLNENPLSWVRTGRVGSACDPAADHPTRHRDRPGSLADDVSCSSRVTIHSPRCLRDVAIARVSDLPSFPREMMDAYIPPTTASGRRLRRIVSHTTEEAMMRVAVGEQVHPTVEGWLDHHAHPGVIAVPISDLHHDGTPALAWVAAVRSPRVGATCVSSARDVLADTELADDT